MGVFGLVLYFYLGFEEYLKFFGVLGGRGLGVGGIGVEIGFFRLVLVGVIRVFRRNEK